MIAHRLAAAAAVVLLALPAGARAAEPRLVPAAPEARPLAVDRAVTALDRLSAAARALAAGDGETALSALDALDAAPPDPALPPGMLAGRVDLLRGMAYLAVGRPADALEPLDRAARRLPQLADLARLRRADALRRAGDPAAAAQGYAGVLRDFPKSPFAPEARAALGAAKVEAGDLAGAVEADRAALATGLPDDVADLVRLRLGDSLERLGRIAEAAAAYRTLVVERPLGPAARDAERRLAALGPPKSPLRALSNEERLTRGLILFEAYRSREALADLMAVDLSALPGGESGPTAQDVRLKRGLALFRLRRYPEAARELSPLAGLSTPVGEEARFWRARALARQGRAREAIAEFTAIAEQAPGSRFAGQAAYLAAVVLDDQGEAEEARARFRALADRVGRAPLAADALWNVAWRAYRKGDLAAAAEVLGEIVQRFAGSDAADRALYWLARTELKLGEVALAVPRLKDLVARRPLSYYGIQAARRLEEIDREVAAGDPPAARRPSPPPEPTCCEVLPARPVATPILERAAMLVQLGLLAEARTELAAIHRRGGDVPPLEVARLLHAAGDYSRPLAIARGLAGVPLERLGLDPDGRLFALAFPRGYRDAVEAEARAAGVPVHLAYAIIRAESLFDPAAVSPVGARGLMQLMPATAESLAETVGLAPFDPQALFQPAANLRFGITLLGRLLARYPGRPYLAMAAYNAGPEAVSRWLAAFGNLPEDEFVESIPYTETRGYVMKVTAFWKTYDTLY
ncbi:MAG TPA: transglycosylase SLT domain-containing protein [Thermodesulfobacteriota bacterium]